ncbi:hypothetical protein A9Q76_08800 [Arcobacter sp. 31_11_sub10_T18]|nr:hypothetical protein A9Q76_08800 [Arcobacter sp. 31_11_sub10_T18]
MNFNDLSNEEKQQLHVELTNNANSVGGTNFFLQMIEDIREEKPKALLNKTATFHYKKGKIEWQKSIFKDTLTCLYDGMRREEKTGDMLNGINPKEYKAAMNMMRALKPVNLVVTPKDGEYEGFNMEILDASEEKKTKISLMFKIVFFYNVTFAKEVLNYKAEEA